MGTGRALGRWCRLDTSPPGRAASLANGRRLIGRKVTLTFDDGPLRKTTGRILDVLRAHRLRATFFVVGKMINIHTYRLLRRMRREGHRIGNHGYHHDVEMLKGPAPRRRLEAELGLTQAVVDLALLARGPRDFERLRRRLLGGDPAYEFPGQLTARWPAMARRWARILAERAPHGRSPYPMRFTRPAGGSPYGRGFTKHHHRLYARTLAKLGLINVLWDAVTPESDTRLPPAARRDPARQTAALVQGARRGGILLAHDRIHPQALARALRELTVGLDAVEVVSLVPPTYRRFGCDPRQVSLALRARYALTPEPREPSATLRCAGWSYSRRPRRSGPKTPAPASPPRCPRRCGCTPRRR